MRVPLDWLKDYVEIDVDVNKYAEAMTLSGSKVEAVEKQGDEISNVVVGRILSIEEHPDADKLQVARVDVGNGSIQIVTGAPNIKVGYYVPVALEGAILPEGMKIKKTKLRGMESCGMMCSIQELGLTKDDYPNADENGIFILENSLVPGQDIKKLLGLDDIIVEFEITPNRPDCLSMTGIARETAATLKTSFDKPSIEIKEEADEAEKYASVEILDGDLCPRYAARVVKDVKIEASPEWMRTRLRAAGVRTVNNIVDITNYVMLEMGQPMHAFDLDYLEGGKITVRRAEKGEMLQTLDEEDRKLDFSMLVIADEKKPVAVAGVMGGANSEINENTKKILFESANFNGTSVRHTAKALGMRTEASSRFEKGLDVKNTVTAVDRAVQLVEELNAGKVCKGVIDCYVQKPEKRTVKFSPKRINALLGTDISEEKMLEIFRSVELEIEENNSGVIIPSFRSDIECEADLAEEVARFYDYNNIEPTLLEGKSSTIGGKTFKQKTEDIIKNTMIACGLSETYTYSFTGPKVFDKIRASKDSDLRKTVKLSNPLGEDYSIMRTTTIPDMLDVISRNYNRRIEGAGFYELSYIYKPLNTKELPVEKQVLTLGMFGGCDFYDLKGIAEELFELLGIENCDFHPVKNRSEFHPGRTALLILDSEEIGIIGQIHPEVTENFECHAQTYVGVIDMDPLVKYASMAHEYKPLPRFPSVSRDIALMAEDNIMVKQIEEIIKKESGDTLEEIKLFDVYKGEQIPEGKKSIAYSVTFRAEDKTLTDEEVNNIMQRILGQLKRKLDVQLRE